ncbi:universal stress protein [Deinococcus aquiradiocola]|uniref:Universal stress protein n=1 Tax=Deinococcus aquiradiocola TaxID=393059 RepID=A0A917PB83_9DEIO|nr:universal stress protein [Deinococcus aquiradiocola]GGJ69360.1 universal stress protein [Deinococcus aquiradiocola]
MFERILVTTDGSPLATLALPVAADLARRYGSAVTLLYVVPPAYAPVALAEGMAYAYDDALEQERISAETERVVGNALRVLDLPDVTVVRAHDTGLSVQDCIAEHVARLDARLVVMSTHGRGGLAHLFLGSVAEGVLRHVHVPVLLVRDALPETGGPHRSGGHALTVT